MTTSPASPAKARFRLPRFSLMSAASAAVVMVLAALLAGLLAPRLQAMGNAPDLDRTVPKAFGDWRMVPDGHPQIDVSQGVESAFEQPYDQTVMRTYVNSQGEHVMLALAWGERQRQDVKVHRPEVCYPAQGLRVLRLEAGEPIRPEGLAHSVPTVDLLAEAPGGFEAVRYWIRIGESYGGDGLKARWYILQEGLRGRIPDGILVRASQRLTSKDQLARSEATMQQFLTELTAAVPPATRGLLVR